VRCAIVARERTRYSVRQLCRTLELSVSGFHEYLQRLERPDPEAALRAEHESQRQLLGQRGSEGFFRMIEKEEVTGVYATKAAAHIAI